jgi:CubicO group peptidase (beta-lactamase class C family)
LVSVASIAESELKTRVAEVLNRWPTAGLAVGVVRDGSLEWFYGHGVADIESGTPVAEDTVFRIASITKTFTAIAVMQLWEQGLIDLDAPANDYLRAYRLIPAKAGFRPATLRHLLTHTAGVRAVRTASDLLRPALGWGAPVGHPAPSLAEYYRGGLRVDVEPGTKWAYSNHGFATLGQIVEDVSGIPLDRYFRERVFGPLAMESSDLVRSERVRPRLATGYALGSGGLEAVADREIVTAGSSAVYSTTSDMARYVAALLGGGANEHGSVLRPETLARMFEPHYQLDPRIPGMGLGFFRDEVAGHRTVSHDGIWMGFRTDMVLAPDEGLGVLAFANTGGFEPRGAPVPVANAVLRSLLGLPDDVVRTDVPDDPRVWRDLCGWYSFGPGVLTDPQPRALFGAGLEVVVRRGQLTIRGQMPIPAVRRGLRLHPVADDPYAFRVDLSALGAGSSPVVFSRGPDGEVTALHLGLTPMSFQKQPTFGTRDYGSPARWSPAPRRSPFAGSVRERLTGGARPPAAEASRHPFRLTSSCRLSLP